MDLVVEYAKVRRQFGQPIGAFQAVQHLCVDMYETVELARSGVIHALWAADAGSRDERHAAAMRTKAFSGRLATVADTAIQVFGGIGYTWEHDAHLYLKRLLSWSAFRGGSDRYLVQLGAQFAGSVLRWKPNGLASDVALAPVQPAQSARSNLVALDQIFGQGSRRTGPWRWHGA